MQLFYYNGNEQYFVYQYYMQEVFSNTGMSLKDRDRDLRAGF
jgi:hypothetical protein